jgi:SAM-dependent methyltransferase
MSSLEAGVARHYGAYDVLARIRAGLAEMGHGAERVPPEVLRPVDEFHIGGAEATDALLDRLEIGPETKVLDIGSGIGGPARHVALRHGASVTGIDLTPAFVEAARELTRMTGVENVRFEVGSATAIPFPDASFDLALLLHVGMNVADKEGLFREARRVLRDGGVFAIYDVMRLGDGALAFPVPWAETEDLSALERPEVYRDAAKAAGFELVEEEDRSAIALAFFARIQAEATGAAPAPLGLHTLMGPTVKEKVANMVAAIRASAIGPVQMMFRTQPA